MAEAAEVDKEALFEEAVKKLEENQDKWTVYDLAEWWKQYYPKLGHKRLGRVLKDVEQKKDSKEEE